MATKQLPVTPPHAPGQGVAELLRRMPVLVRGDAINFNGDSAVNVFEVPGNILIRRIDVNVVTAYDASGTSAAATGTITVPGDTGAVTVWDAGGTKLQVAGTAEYSPSTTAGLIKTPDSGGMVIFLQAPSTSTAGQVEIFMEYFDNVDRLS